MRDAAFAGYLKDQAFLHPGMTAQDGVKLCFQAAFGAEHILTDPAQARAALLAEFAQTPSRKREVFEPISAEYSRCNLAAWKQLQLPPEWLFQIFFHSAPGNSVLDNSAPGNSVPEKGKNAEALFMEYLAIVTACADQGLLPFSGATWRKYLEEYLAGGVRPAHHSEAYRLKEQPAYRIVKRGIGFPVYKNSPPSGTGYNKQAGPRVVAIDGRAAAGRHPCHLLSQVLTAEVIPMDDFFLRRNCAPRAGTKRREYPLRAFRAGHRI